MEDKFTARVPLVVPNFTEHHVVTQHAVVHDPPLLFALVDSFLYFVDCEFLEAWLTGQLSLLGAAPNSENQLSGQSQQQEEANIQNGPNTVLRRTKVASEFEETRSVSDVAQQNYETACDSMEFSNPGLDFLMVLPLPNFGNLGDHDGHHTRHCHDCNGRQYNAGQD